MPLLFAFDNGRFSHDVAHLTYGNEDKVIPGAGGIFISGSKGTRAPCLFAKRWQSGISPVGKSLLHVLNAHLTPVERFGKYCSSQPMAIVG